MTPRFPVAYSTMFLIGFLLISLNLWANYLLKSEIKTKDEIIVKQHKTIAIWKQAYKDSEYVWSNEVRRFHLILTNSENLLDLCEGKSIQGK